MDSREKLVQKSEFIFDPSLLIAPSHLLLDDIWIK